MRGDFSAPVALRPTKTSGESDVTGWTEERVEKLIADWKSGFSGDQCAARLGGVTRCAVLGKVHRLGLSVRSVITRAKSAVRKGPIKRLPSRRKRVLSPERAALAAITAEREAIQAAPDLDIPVSERRAFLDLEPGDCRWAYGDGPFQFCNRLQVGTSSRECKGALAYCDFHSKRAYAPPQPGRRPDDRRQFNRGGYLSPSHTLGTDGTYVADARTMELVDSK